MLKLFTKEKIKKQKLMTYCKKSQFGAVYPPPESQLGAVYPHQRFLAQLAWLVRSIKMRKVESTMLEKTVL